MIKIAPSILAADPLNLEKDIRAAEKAGCDWIHVDVMDAHFVPNLAYSVDTVRRLREVTDLPLDVHLMMDHPETLLDAFLDAGASSLTIHAEIDADIPGMLTKIRNRGRMAGIALKPNSEIELIQPYIDLTDLVLMMTVEPGFADGGIREDNIEMLAANGLTVAVMGTALFRNSDMAACIRRLHRIPAGKQQDRTADE